MAKLLAVSALLLWWADSAFAQVVHYRMVKGPIYLQTADNTQPLAPLFWTAEFYLGTEMETDANSITVSGGGITGSISLEQEGTEWFYGMDFASEAALNAVFPSSTSYTMVLSGDTLGTLSQDIELGASAYPNVPYLTGSIWTDALSYNTDLPQTFTWNNAGPLTEDNGRTLFEVIDVDEDERVYFSQATGVVLADTVPAGTLAPSKTYEGYLEFTNAGTVDGAGGFEIDGEFGHNVGLDFTILTLSGSLPALSGPRLALLCLGLLGAGAFVISRAESTRAA